MWCCAASLRHNTTLAYLVISYLKALHAHRARARAHNWSCVAKTHASVAGRRYAAPLCYWRSMACYGCASSSMYCMCTCTRIILYFRRNSNFRRDRKFVFRFRKSKLRRIENFKELKSSYIEESIWY